MTSQCLTDGQSSCSRRVGGVFWEFLGTKLALWAQIVFSVCRKYNYLKKKNEKKTMFRAKLSLVRASTILSSARRSARLPWLTKKQLPDEPRHLRRISDFGRRVFDEANPILLWRFFSGQYLKSYFEKEVKNEFYKDIQSRFGFSLPRAFRMWSLKSRSPYNFSGNCFLCVFTWGPIQP